MIAGRRVPALLMSVFSGWIAAGILYKRHPEFVEGNPIGTTHVIGTANYAAKSELWFLPDRFAFDRLALRIESLTHCS